MNKDEKAQRDFDREKANGNHIPWQDLFDYLRDPVFIINSDRKVVKTNNVAADLLERSKDEIEGKMCHELLRKLPEPSSECPLEACLSGDCNQTEVFYASSIGRHLKERIFPITEEKRMDSDMYFALHFKDITEEKQRINNLASYPEHNPHPVIEWDENLQLNFANNAAKNILAGDVLKGTTKNKLNDIKERLQEGLTGEYDEEDTGEKGTLYKEFKFKGGENSGSFGFYFHLLPDKKALRAYGFDITEKHRVEERLREANKNLELLIEINHLITRVENQSGFLDRACDTITDVKDYPLVWIGEKETGPDKKVIPVAHSGFEEKYLKDLDIRWSKGELGQGPTGKAIRENEPQLMEGITQSNDPDYRPWQEDAEKYGFSSSIALPIPRGEGDAVYGTLNIYSQNKMSFSKSSIHLLQELANDLGYGLHYLRNQKELQEMTIGTLEALSQTVEAKDEYTGEHINRVQEYAEEVGKRLNLSRERLHQLGYASRLHDIGKVRIPDSILGKPGDLTDKEWKEMRKHPEIGAEIVSKVPRLERAAKIIAQHQEKYDGTGYPKGLKGEDITLEARIIAVVDAWDAMQTDRPYRDAIPKSKAISELKENSGSQFDPKVVETFLGIINMK